VTLSVIAYLVSTLVSTAFSESFNVSMWGLVPGQDTYPAYTIICYVVLFGIVSTHLRNKAQVVRLLWAVAIMGTLVGGYTWAQFYGHDVFNLREIIGGTLLGSTMGNSILAGALLLMSTIVSLAAATLVLEQPVRTRRFWGKLGLWVVMLTLQMTALFFAFNRGPWGGAIVALVVLLVLVAGFAGWRSLAKISLVLALAGALSVALVLWPLPIPTGDPIKVKTEFVNQEYPAPADALDVASFASQQIKSVTSVGRGVDGGGLSGRIGIWQASGRLMVERPWFGSDSARLPLLRPFIGYGPDMFKYTYLLERDPRGPDQLLISERFAHNFLIHKGVELGLLGLLTTLGLFAAPVIVGGFQLFRRRQIDSTFYKLVMVALMAAFAGRFVEQMVGVAAVSDLTIFWVLLALFAALPVAFGASQTAPPLNPAPTQGYQHRQFTPAAKMDSSGVQTIVMVVVGVFLIAGIGALTWTKSINYLEAGFKARQGLDSIHKTEFQTALVFLNQSIALAPDISVYHTLRAAVYSGYRQQNDGPREPECARLAAATPYERCLLHEAHLSDLEAAKQRPFEWQTRLNLADSTLGLALMDQDPSMTAKAVGLYREVAQMDPQTWWHWERLAAVHLQAGQPEAALGPLEKSLAILDGIPRSANSRLLQGMAYLALNEPTAALTSFNESIRLKPDFSTAFANRGASYNQVGQYQRAIQDLDQAIKLNPDIAVAYNNRGNSYGNLDQLQRAIDDYDKAIHLDPRFALAYSNRALAHTYLGRDDEAREDVERGIELGLDPGPILAKIEEVRNAR
jgi:tetratricopeptide (TPR) repeat protein/O-antigen ligase